MSLEGIGIDSHVAEPSGMLVLRRMTDLMVLWLSAVFVGGYMTFQWVLALVSSTLSRYGSWRSRMSQSFGSAVSSISNWAIFDRLRFCCQMRS